MQLKVNGELLKAMEIYEWRLIRADKRTIMGLYHENHRRPLERHGRRRK